MTTHHPSALTRQQLAQMTQEYQVLQEWTTVRDFCAQVYGPTRAVKVEIETYGEYNDEGGTDYSVSSVTAYDAAGTELEFDLSQPFWHQKQFADLHQRPDQTTEASDEENDDEDEDEDEDEDDDTQDAALDALKEWSVWREEDKAQVAREGWIQWSDLPCDEHNGGDDTYDLTIEPKVSFPVIAVS